MNTKFDLTTKDGLLEAANQIKDKDLLLLLVPGFGPFAYLGKKAIDAGERLFASTETTIDQQRRAAIEIIKAGRESGAESLEVTLSQQAGLDFGSDIEGIPVKVVIGKTGNMTIKVKYAKEA